jgi:molybdopterin-guanine dinucleotide biosynthesis protein A
MRDGAIGREDASTQAHPTCAVFGLSCLPVILGNLAQGQLRARDVLEALHVRWVDDEEIRRVDPEGRSLLNANTPDDWRELSHSNRVRSPRD